MTPEQRILLEESCRSADRLDELDALLRGKGAWFDLDIPDGSEVATVVVDRALAEARQQQNVLKQLLVTFRQLSPGAKPQERGSRGAYGSGSSVVAKDEVGERRASRRGDWRSA